MVIYVLAAFAIVLQIALAGILIRKYLQTRDIGFVWIGVAVVLWPIMSRFLSHGNAILTDRLSDGKSVGYFPYTLVENGQMTIADFIVSFNAMQKIIGVSLLLVAIIYLSKTKSSGKLQPTAPLSSTSRREASVS